MPKGTGMCRNRSLTICSLLLLLAGIASAQARPAAGTVVVHRDEWGVPYIVASNDNDAAFGLGYAMAEDRIEDLYKNIRTAIGRYAEAFGDEGDNVDIDYAMRITKNAERAQKTLADSPEAAQQLCAAFINGVKAYEAAHPEKRPEYAIPLEPWHPLAIGQAMVMRWPLGNIQDELNNTRRRDRQNGSNQWAVSKERSADGVPILLTDPHLTWEGMAVFYEAHVFGNPIQMQGFFIVGSPLLGLGHNGHVGWAATTGGPDTADIYEVKVNPNNQLQYEYDGEYRNAKLEFIQIPVKGKPAEMRPAGFTHLGPLFSEPNKETGTAFVGATPYLDSTKLGEQFYRMCLAKNNEEFYQAMGLNEYMDQNIMFADRDGNIQYVRVGRVPIRPEGHDWTMAVPGHTSATAWKGIHPIEDLVQIKNPAQGYMQNCNISPAHMMLNSPMTPDKYSADLYNVSWDSQNTRGQRALDLLSVDDNITREEAIAICFDVTDVLADEWHLALENALKDSAAAKALSADAKEAASAMLTWDGQFLKESTVPPVVMFWRNKVQGNIDEDKLLSKQPLSAENNLALLQGLSDTLAEMKTQYGKLGMTWGDIHKVGRNGTFYPVDGVVLGSNKRTRTLFNVGAKEMEKGSGVYIANNGTMSMALMFMRKEGIETYTVTPWGQSADPTSPHHTDQAEKLYSQRKFKKIAITPGDAAKISKTKIELATS